MEGICSELKPRFSNLEVGFCFVISDYDICTLVTVALHEYPDLLIFSYTGIALPWSAKVAHSQGALLGTRKDIIKAEYERIEKYKQKGDLSSGIEILEYLNKRDRAL